MPISRTKPDSIAADLIALDAEPGVELAADAATEPTEEPAQAGQPKSGPAPRTASGGHPFRHHEIPMGDGKLVLDREGSIRSIAADGSVTASWEPDDPEWDRYAIRFGLRPSSAGGSSVPGHPPLRAKRPRV
jgi:hypothetical protein